MTNKMVILFVTVIVIIICIIYSMSGNSDVSSLESSPVTDVVQIIEQNPAISGNDIQIISDINEEGSAVSSDSFEAPPEEEETFMVYKKR